MTEPLFDISEFYGGFPCYMTLVGHCFQDEEMNNPIELKTYWGVNYLTDDDGEDTPINFLKLVYCFPRTAPPKHESWKKRTYNKKATTLRELNWDPLPPPPNPLKFKNGLSYRSDSKLKEKYINTEGPYYRVRIKKLNYSCRFATLETAIKVRNNLLCG